jgi:nucleotide-binding universal stress UspA family protein
MLAGIHQQDWAAAEDLAVRVADQLRAHDLITEAQVRDGRSAEGILEQTVARSADLIGVGARGRTRAGPFRMGDVAQKVVKYASYSVLVVR